MKAGDEIICKYCGTNSFLVKKVLMDGWTKSGEILICSSCSKVLEKLDSHKENFKENEKTESSINMLADLLGEKTIDKPNLETEEEKQFCRDCMHYISHPFLNRCNFHQKEVNPMDDCSQFKKKAIKEN